MVDKDVNCNYIVNIKTYTGESMKLTNLFNAIDSMRIPLNDPELYEMDGFFDDLVKEMGAYGCSANVLEECKNMKRIHIDLPGVLKEDIDMQVDENGIRVKAERKGFKSTTYSKSYKLPPGVDLDNVQAKYENGVLIIELSKQEQKSKKVNIK